ncbi:MAG: AAA family ATPase [Planctomycetota bacterium]|nr:AAA family ATPase [Planctomycetota bacterium]
MNPPTLYLTRAEVRHMPGFPNGGLEADNLCSGVNIIYGPNASGKSTLGRAIHYLLQAEQRPHDVSLYGTLELDATSLSLDYNMGRIKCQKRADGSDLDCPTLAPRELGNRYLLALHDLISAETGHDLAQGITRELAGGYDINQASRELQHQDGESRPRKLMNAHVAARQNYAEARGHQDDLLAEQGTLDQLRSQQQTAQDSLQQLQWIAKARECLETRAQLEQADQHVASFPQGIERVTHHDSQQLKELHKTLHALDQEHQSEQERLNVARAQLAKSGLPDAGLPAGLVPELRRKYERLSGLQEDIKRHQREIATSQAALAQALREIGPQVDLAEANAIDPATLDALFDFARQVEKIRSEQVHARTLQQWLSEDPPTQNAETLPESIRLLYRWLALEEEVAEPGQPGLWSRWAPGLATALVGLAMGFIVHWTWYLLLLPAAGLLVWAFRPQRASGASLANRRDALRREYESQTVDSPASWSTEQILTQIQTLQRQHAEARIAEEKRIKWSELKPRLDDLNRRTAELEETRPPWIAQLKGASEEIFTIWLLAQNINRCQQQRQRLAETQELLQVATSDFKNRLDEINRALATYGIEAVGDPDAIREQVELLAQRQQAHESATQTLETGEIRLARIANEQAETKAATTALFDRVGLAVEQTSLLHTWGKERDAYDEAVHNRDQAAGVYRQTTKALTEHPELLTLSAEELTSREHQYREQADRWDSISESIGGIERAIQTARSGHDLETTLANQVQAADTLRDQRERDYNAVVGGLLARHIELHEQAEELPPILRRARELFAAITHGRYELQVQNGDPPAFRAKETARDVGLALDELSSGTRLQLLLAARIAFVERQEQGVRVPLLLDETLGNSDERRAQEIIDATLEICRDGRQVFYFTAQQDEVAKWQQRLTACDDIEHRIIDLATQRDFSESERLPIRDYVPRPTPEVPAPDDLNWLAYGDRLRVAHPEPGGAAGGYHLWFLIDEPRVLYKLLKHGINKWGQLQSLVSHGRVEGVSEDSTIFLRAQAAARLVKAVLKYCQVGHGRSVDRRALQDSGAVSETYIDRVEKLAETHGGNAKAILKALQEGGVSGFRTHKREELAEYFRTEEYLDDKNALSSEEIENEVRGAAFKDLQKQWIRPEQIDILLSLLTAQRPPSPDDAAGTATHS